MAENKIDSKNNKIVLSIKANESKMVNASLQSYQSNDNLGSFESKEINLINGKETTLEFEFFGFYDYTYWVTIKIDNTMIDLTVKPQDSN